MSEATGGTAMCALQKCTFCSGHWQTIKISSCLTCLPSCSCWTFRVSTSVGCQYSAPNRTTRPQIVWHTGSKVSDNKVCRERVIQNRRGALHTYNILLSLSWMPQKKWASLRTPLRLNPKSRGVRCGMTGSGQRQ